MTQTHTPGPWQVVTGNRNWIKSQSGDPICQLPGYTMVDERTANARLIAAAPETAAKLVTAEARIASYETDMRLIEAERDKLKALNAKMLEKLKDIAAHLEGGNNPLYGSGLIFSEDTPAIDVINALIAEATGKDA